MRVMQKIDIEKLNNDLILFQASSFSWLISKSSFSRAYEVKGGQNKKLQELPSLGSKEYKVISEIVYHKTEHCIA